MFKRKRSAQDFSDEIKAHLELEAEELRREGLSEEAARRKARHEFGNIPAAQEHFYMRDKWAPLERFLRDIKFAARSLLHSPGFAVTTILTLALGIGANTAVFSVMNAVLLRSLPVTDPNRLVYLRTTDPPAGTGYIDSNETFSYPVYDVLRRQNSGLTPIMAYVPLGGKVAVRYGGASPEEAEGDMVSGTFFSGLGVNLIRGRGFTEQDETDHAPVGVISYNYWTRRFARNSDVLGKTLYVNGIPITIVGVAAEGFEGVEGSNSTDFWLPLQKRPELNAYGNPAEDGKTYLAADSTWWCLRLIGRLAPGVSRTQAVAQLQPIYQRVAYTGISQPKTGEKPPILSSVEAKKFAGFSEMQYARPLRILMAMVGLVLLIAMTNVVMLLMARNAARQREFSVRMALGAGRAEMLRQLLAESLILVSIGGALAWAFAELATRLLANWAQIESSLAPDRTVLLFTLVVLVIAALLFGLAPMRVAIAGGAELALKTSAATSNADSGKSRTSRIIVALQMALCVVLLVGGALLIRTLRNLENTSLGMRIEGLVVFGVQPNITSVPDGKAFFRDLIDKLRALPGVESVTIMDTRIGTGWSDNNDMSVDGKVPDATGGPTTVRSNVVGPDFFHTLGVPILAGRDFNDSDTATSPHVGIINEQFAKRFFPKQNPLGHSIGTPDNRFQMTVVGVVKDHKYRSIDEDPIPMAWFMYAQIPITGGKDIELRVHGDPLAILPSARNVVQQMNPNLPLLNPMTQRAQYDQTISSQLLFARLAGFFGILAVVLVATGLYGSLSYRVNMRTAEIGVRMAVGARRGQVVWMILRDSLLLTTFGVVIGVPLAMMVGNALESSLYGVKPLDAISYFLAVLGVALVALIASAIPAGRAASVDPMTALRTD